MQPRVYSHTQPALFHNNTLWVSSPAVASLGTIGTSIPPGTINYQGDGYVRRKKRRNRTQELFDALEASIRCQVLGEPMPSDVAEETTTLAAVPVSLTATHYDAAVRHLIALASDHALLSARVVQLQYDLAAYERRVREQGERDDEDDWMMLS